MHVFDPTSGKEPNLVTASSTTISGSQGADKGTTVTQKSAATGDWKISLRDLERTPNQIFIDHISRGEIDSTRKAKLKLADYREQVLSRMSLYNSDVEAFLQEKFVEQADEIGRSVKERRQRRYIVKKQDLERKHAQSSSHAQNTEEIGRSDVDSQQDMEKIAPNST